MWLSMQGSRVIAYARKETITCNMVILESNIKLGQMSQHAQAACKVNISVIIIIIDYTFQHRC